MAPITLLKKGSLIARMGEDQSKLDTIIPINYIMDWIGQKLKSKTITKMDDRVIVLLSKTGSGKSTSLAPNIYLRYFNSYRKRILITQPRVLTTKEIPLDINNIQDYKKTNSNGLSIELYRNLGYQTQQFVRKPTEKGILFSTTGILLQFLKTMTDEQFIKKYKFIIIDEAHDRSMDVDMIMLLMKRLIKRNMTKDPPFLILMSATLNVDLYSKYFSTKTIFEVDGQSQPIETHYQIADVSNIFEKTCEIINNIDKNENPKEYPNARDIIIFMPSISPITQMLTALHELNKDLPRKILPLSLTSGDISSGTNDYKMIMDDIKNLSVKVNNKSYPVYRRVIVATNVAETGITLERLRYCIDTGMQFSVEYNARHGNRIMITKSATSSMALQRRGRVGRKLPGTFYPLYTESTFNSMVVDNVPNILVSDITNSLLAIIANNKINDIDDMPIYDLITSPSDDCINESLEKLFTLGAIDQSCNITKIGKYLNSFRKIGVEASRMIISGIINKASIKEMCQLSCLVELKKSDLFLKNKNYTVSDIIDEIIYPDEESYKQFDESKCDMDSYNKLKAKLLIGCEFIEMLLIYQKFLHRANTLTISDLSDWCLKKGLNFRVLINVTESIDEVYWTMVERLKINPIKSDHDDIYQILRRAGPINDRELVESVSLIKKCIHTGFRHNRLVWDGNNYKSNTGITVMVSSKLVSPIVSLKNGAPFKQTKPKILIYKDLLTRADRVGMFAHEASIVSIMDGFVDIDVEFGKT